MKMIRIAPPSFRRQAFFAFVFLFACSTGSFDFTPTQDDAVMAEIASVFEGGEDVVLTLCEDRELSDAWQDPGGCQEAHVIRGGGRGLAHTESEPSNIGCGGCPFNVLAYVTGTLSGGPFDEPAEVAGEILTGDLYDEPFAYPFRLNLRCQGGFAPCTMIGGTLEQDGSLTLEVYIHSDVPTPDHTFQLAAGDAAVCGLP
jgi:hypothetical protein